MSARSGTSRLGKLAGETAVYGISSVVGRLITFLLVPFYTQFFPPDRYGVVVLFYTAFVFLNIVYTYGTESAYLKYAADSGDATSREKIFSVAVLSLALSSVLLSGLLILFAGEVVALIGADSSWEYLILYAAGILALDTMAVVPFAELRLQNSAVRFAVLKIISILVNVGLNIWLIVGLRRGIESIFVANLAASGVTLLLLTPVFRDRLRMRFSGAVWGQMLRFGLPFLPGGLGYAITDRVNLFFLGRMQPETVIRLYGDEIDVARLAEQASRAGSLAPGSGTGVADAVYGQYVAGVFGTVWKLGILMMLLAQMFRFAWQPFFLQHQDDPDARELFGKVLTAFTAVAGLVFLGVSFFTEELVAIPLPGGRTLIERSYWLGLYLVPIALLAYIFQGWYYNFSAGAYITGRTRYFVHCAAAGALTSVAMNALLVPSYGMTAAAWATTGAYGVMAAVLFVLIRPHYRVAYQTGRVFLIVTAAMMLFAAWWFVPSFRTWPIELGMIAAYSLAAVGATFDRSRLGLVAGRVIRPT